MTYKTVYLITLATVKRVSELHALSANDDCLRFNQDGSVMLQTLPGFVAKNRRPADGSQRVTISPLLANPTLCPVRALRIDLQRTKGTRRVKDPLILSIRNPTGATTPQLISTWIKSTIALANRHGGLVAKASAS